MKITSDILVALRPKLEVALAPVLKELGLTCRLGKATYSRDGSNGTFKLELATLSEDGTAMTKEAADFLRFAKVYGWDAKQLFSTVVHVGKQYKIMGYLPRSKRFPILAERLSDGRQFKLPELVVTRILQREPTK